MKWAEWLDDKTQVILCVTLLGVLAMFAYGDAGTNLLDNIITGLFGVAVGRATTKDAPNEGH